MFIKTKYVMTLILIFLSLTLFNCGEDDPGELPDEDLEDDPKEISFYFGADLSYVNQILDHGGLYKVGGEMDNPYKIFKDNGTNLVRLRLWHDPVWTKEVYGNEGTQLYNDLLDVEKSIRLSKEQKMEVLLDFHYSDTWADPGRQEVPEAWLGIDDVQVLKDSVYNYTFKTLKYLDDKGLMPEFVQIGNETNCGMMFSNAPDGFPPTNGCNGQWENLREVINSGIKAVRDVTTSSTVKTKIILHVADPVNVEWWFDNVINGGEVDDFEIIGFSYYPIWHTGVSVAELSETVASFKRKYNKEIMILETAYPWTSEGNDGYNNIFGSDNVSGYPVSPDGQLAMMRTITQQLIDGGGYGIIYWEPAWISSDMKDLWGTGSAWENNTFFDFDGNLNQGIDYMTYHYN